jgi:membrane complex biogenesis BtpA family protein
MTVPSTAAFFPEIVSGRPAVIGMIHFSPLPGSPGYKGEGAPAIIDRALVDGERLVAGGVDGLLVENFGDAPFYPGQTPPEVAAHMAVAAAAIRQRFDQPLGVNVLRSDGLAALAVAQAAGASFIRVNVLAGARLTDQGLIQGIAHELLRKRSALGAGAIRIFADVDVKHSAPLAARPIEEEALELVERAGADALIVSGPATGRAADLDQLDRVRAAVAGRVPVLVGSGATLETLPALRARADGLIVGTHFKCGGDVRAPVDQERVRQFMSAL